MMDFILNDFSFFKIQEKTQINKKVDSYSSIL